MLLDTFKELLRMPIARIIMCEQHSKAGRDQLLKEHRDAVESGFLKDCEFSVAVRTGETSYMVLTVYATEELADANRDARVKWHKDRASLIREDFYHEGEVATLIKGGGAPLLTNYPAKLY
jgi:hypothetical protein